MQTLVSIGSFEEQARKLLDDGEFDVMIDEFGQEREMDTQLFEELESNLKDAVKYAKGEASRKSVYFVLSPVDIKRIRQGVDMSQSVFARTFHLSLDTIKGWEQGKRKPDAAATNYLLMIKAHPDHVQKTLAA